MTQTTQTKNFREELAQECARLDVDELSHEVCAGWECVVPIFMQALQNMNMRIVEIEDGI